ncbi:sodium-dependent glucose transporter 1A-like [Ptychodera flava]|uniref:sodium-dependent glucose transporter 1A-like n=1 Tax=Ptychodera flava TaxID=63121 RepID=UPI00396A7243
MMSAEDHGKSTQNGEIKSDKKKGTEVKTAEVGLLEKPVPEDEPPCKELDTFFYKVIKTVSLYFSFFGLGLCLAVIGPSLLDLKFQVGATLQQVTLVFTARSVGYVIGSIVGGVCFDKFENQLLLALTMFGTSVTGFFVPWCNVLWLLIVVISLWGFFTGFLDTGGNVVLVVVWGKENGPWMQALHFLFALGATMAPLVAAPFLTDPVSINATAVPEPTTVAPWYGGNAGMEVGYSLGPLGVSGSPENQKSVSTRDTDLEEFQLMLEKMMERVERSVEEVERVSKRSALIMVNTTEGSAVFVQNAVSFPTAQSPQRGIDGVQSSKSDGRMNTSSNSSASTDESMETGDGKLWIPYTIIAVYNFVGGLPFLILYLKGSRRLVIPKKKDNGQVDSSHVKENLTFKVTLLVFLYFFIFAYVGHEMVYGGFIYTFAIKSDMGFTVESASYLNSVFWGSFAFARALGICCAMFLRPRSMLVLDLVGLCTASTLLAIFGGSVVGVLWGASILLGMSMATVFPTAIAWTERYIKLTGKSTAVFCVAASSSEMFLPWIIGFLFEAYTFMVLMYVTLSLSITTTVVYIMMQILASYHGEKPDDPDDHEVDQNEESVEMMSPKTIA